jgi:Flp pilus assembly protein TadG
MVTMIGFSALVVDIGNVALHKAKTQSVVDAIALAAAQDLPDTVKATETAEHYAELNGIDPSKIQISFTNSNNSIRVKASENVDYFFAKIFNQNGCTVESNAGAAKNYYGAAFEYALFSGSETINLVLNGSKMDVGGSVHTNSTFKVSGSFLTITEAAEACNDVITTGNWINIGERIGNADYIDMPDFSEMIRTETEQAGTVYNGDQTFNGSNLDVNSSIFVNGSATFSGSRFYGKGCILATNTVTFEGSNLTQSEDDAVCIYSENGDVIINGNGAEIDGIIYAPHGRVIFNGSNQIIKGRVVASSIVFNGSALDIESGFNDVNSLPFSGTNLDL